MRFQLVTDSLWICYSVGPEDQDIAIGSVTFVMDLLAMNLNFKLCDFHLATNYTYNRYYVAIRYS